jgi:hypothetical protein
MNNQKKNFHLIIGDFGPSDLKLLLAMGPVINIGQVACGIIIGCIRPVIILRQEICDPYWT